MEEWERREREELEKITSRREWKSFACKMDDHFSCVMEECTCGCHGDEPPAGVREPREPEDEPPLLSMRKE